MSHIGNLGHSAILFPASLIVFGCLIWLGRRADAIAFAAALTEDPMARDREPERARELQRGVLWMHRPSGGRRTPALAAHRNLCLHDSVRPARRPQPHRGGGPHGARRHCRHRHRRRRGRAVSTAPRAAAPHRHSLAGDRARRPRQRNRRGDHPRFRPSLDARGLHRTCGSAARPCPRRLRVPPRTLPNIEPRNARS